MTLNLVDEEAMALECELAGRERTVRVQVTVTFKDDNGVEWVAGRIIKMKLHLVRPGETGAVTETK